MIFQKIEDIFMKAPARLSSPEKQQAWEAFGKSIDDILKEFNLMKDVLHRNFPSTPCGFTHNDLLLENVVHNPEKGTVHFIDFEYGCYSYLYFDIGNHFSEYAGVGEADHQTLYPDEKYQKEWLIIYLTEYQRINSITNRPLTDKFLDDVYNQVRVFSLCAYLFWGIWALFQAENSTVDFDYVNFATTRLGAYFARKKEFSAPFLNE